MDPWIGKHLCARTPPLGRVLTHKQNRKFSSVLKTGTRSAAKPYNLIPRLTPLLHDNLAKEGPCEAATLRCNHLAMEQDQPTIAALGRLLVSTLFWAVKAQAIIWVWRGNRDR